MSEDAPPIRETPPELDYQIQRLGRLALVASFLFIIPAPLLLLIKPSSSAFWLVLFFPGWGSCLWIWRDSRAGKVRRALTTLIWACSFVFVLFSAFSGLCVNRILHPVIGDMEVGSEAWVGILIAAPFLIITARGSAWARKSREAISSPASEHRVNHSRMFVGAIGLVAAAVVFILTPANHRGDRNEAATIGALRAINTACVNYSSTYGTFPSALADLRPFQPGTSPSSRAADLIDSSLASGEKYGYSFRYLPAAPQNGAIRSYTVNADPRRQTQPSLRHFYTDESSVIRWEAKRTATAASPPLF
jgi:hypothetical protein